MTEREQLKAELKAEILAELQSQKMTPVSRIIGKEIEALLDKEGFENDRNKWNFKSMLTNGIKLSLGIERLGQMKATDYEDAMKVVKTLIAVVMDERQKHSVNN